MTTKTAQTGRTIKQGLVMFAVCTSGAGALCTAYKMAIDKFVEPAAAAPAPATTTVTAARAAAPMGT
jgi:hypothetical protein